MTQLQVFDDGAWLYLRCLFCVPCRVQLLDVLLKDAAQQQAPTKLWPIPLHARKRSRRASRALAAQESFATS